MILIVLVSFSGCGVNGKINPTETRSVNGTDLYVKIKGAGEQLIVLQGGPGFSHDYFLPHLEPLADEMKLELFYQRGMGRSLVELDSASFSLELLI